MRIVLQHAGNGLYVQDRDVWTSDLKKARDFGTSSRAIRFMRQQRLLGVQVLVAFIEPSCIDTVALQIPGSVSPANQPITPVEPLQKAA